MNVVCAGRAAPADACASTRRSYQHARHAANGARATRALAVQNNNGVSARMDNDSPTLRITGCPKKMERISVPVSVTRVCASVTLLIYGVAPAARVHLRFCARAGARGAMAAAPHNCNVWRPLTRSSRHTAVTR